MVSDTLNNAAPAAYVSNLAGHANLESKKSYAVPNSVVERTMARMVNNSTSNKTETFEEAMNAVKKAEKKQENEFSESEMRQEKLDKAPSIDDNSQNKQYSNVAGRFINYLLPYYRDILGTLGMVFIQPSVK